MARNTPASVPAQPNGWSRAWEYCRRQTRLRWPGFGQRFGSDVDEDSTADKAFVEAAGWGGPNMWFIRVPEPKTAKNRLHFDLRAW